MSSNTITFKKLFGACLALNIFASFVNHIDDTDETYGYWEVLHFLSFGRGMQTWEYAPKFAIRTYAFIAPLVPIVKLYEWSGLSKLEIFHGIRLIFATLTAYSEASLLYSIEATQGMPMMRMTGLFMIFSPGMFFASTSFLPSAIIMSLVMLAISCWMQKQFTRTIVLGCIAVLFTGWPYVGVIFLPLGLHMMYYSANKEGMGGIVSILSNVVVCVVLVGGAAALLDRRYYGTWTFPTLNTIGYNAGGSGDNLYGVESIAYYMRNLALTMGVAWPLGAVAPVILLREYEALRPEHALSAAKKAAIAGNVVLYCCAALWLALLFSRPHKEERFMYPVYPLIAYFGAVSLIGLCDMIGDIVADLKGEAPQQPLTEDFRELNNLASYAGADKDEKVAIAVKKRKTWAYACKNLLIVLSVVSTVSLCFSRVHSQHSNYAGYMQAWKSISVEIEHSAPLQAIEVETKQVTVCTGGEWYWFASSFHLPRNAKLAFVKDNFRAQLPQYFTEHSEGILAGTAAAPLHMNDGNKEEPSRYVFVDQCDYIIASVEEGDVTATEFKSYSPMLRKMIIVTPTNPKPVEEWPGDRSDASDKSEAETETESALGLGPEVMAYFKPLIQHRVLNKRRSVNSIARAFSLPVYSNMHNTMMHYTLYKRVD